MCIHWWSALLRIAGCVVLRNALACMCLLLRLLMFNSKSIPLCLFSRVTLCFLVSLLHTHSQRHRLKDILETQTLLIHVHSIIRIHAQNVYTRIHTHTHTHTHTSSWGHSLWLIFLSWVYLFFYSPQSSPQKIFKPVLGAPLTIGPQNCEDPSSICDMTHSTENTIPPTSSKIHNSDFWYLLVQTQMKKMGLK